MHPLLGSWIGISHEGEVTWPTISIRFLQAGLAPGEAKLEDAHLSCQCLPRLQVGTVPEDSALPDGAL